MKDVWNVEKSFEILLTISVVWYYIPEISIQTKYQLQFNQIISLFQDLSVICQIE